MSEQVTKRTGKKKRRGLSVVQLRLIAAILLACGVLGTAVLPKIFGAGITEFGPLTATIVLMALSWVAIPLYSWMLLRGFHLTHSYPQYLLRLTLLAVVSEWLYDRALGYETFALQGANPVWGLVIALIVLKALDMVRQRKAVGALSAVVAGIMYTLIVVAGLLWNLLLRVDIEQHIMPVGALTLGFVVMMYALESRENTMMMACGLLGAVWLLTPAVGVAVLHYRRDEVLSVSSGEKAGNTAAVAVAKLQWYALYPLMLIVACII